MVAFIDVVHISSEAVLVQFFMGGRIPEAAGVRRDLVCQDDGAVAELAEFELEVYQVDVDALKELLEDVVDLEGIRFCSCTPER